MAKRPSAGKRKDPELVRQLEDATRSDRAIQVVFFLKDAAPPARSEAPVPEDTTSTVRRVLERVEQETGERVADYHVFPNLGSFVVQASARIVEAVFAQREIASASPNKRGSGPQ